VRTIVVYVLHHGTTPEALLGYYPQLSLAAIYDALSYYYDNREEIDAEIAANAALEPPAPSLSWLVPVNSGAWIEHAAVP
jgi:hypothetical protein